MAGNTLQLRVEHLLELLGEEGDQVHQKHRDADPLGGGDDAATPPLGQDPAESERDEQDQPTVTGGSRLVVGEGQGDEGDHRGEKSPESEDCQREDQEEEEIEQVPRRQPIPRDPVGTEECKEPPAGREIQRHRNIAGIGLPSRGGELGSELHSASRLQGKITGADLHSGSTVCGIACDQLSLPPDADRSEIGTLGGVETPDLLTLTGDEVTEGASLAIHVEPELTADTEPLGLLGSHAAKPLFQADRGAGLPAIEGIFLPITRDRGLGSIDGGDAGNIDKTEIGLGTEGEELLRGGGLHTLGIGNHRSILQAKGTDLDRPLSGTNLGLQAAVLIDRHGNPVACDRKDLPSFGKNESDFLLAVLAGDHKLHTGAEDQRHTILEKCVEVCGEKIFLSLPGRTVTL